MCARRFWSVLAVPGPDSGRSWLGAPKGRLAALRTRTQDAVQRTSVPSECRVARARTGARGGTRRWCRVRTGWCQGWCWGGEGPPGPRLPPVAPCPLARRAAGGLQEGVASLLHWGVSETPQTPRNGDILGPGQSADLRREATVRAVISSLAKLAARAPWESPSRPESVNIPARIVKVRGILTSVSNVC